MTFWDSNNKYEERRKQVSALRNDIVNDIVNALKEKGYDVGDELKTFHCTFLIKPDRLLIKPNDDHTYWHTDFIDINMLVEYLREALLIIPDKETVKKS